MKTEELENLTNSQKLDNDRENLEKSSKFKNSCFQKGFGDFTVFEHI